MNGIRKPRTGVQETPTPEPSVFDQIHPDAEESAMREGEAAVDAGRVVSHEAVRKWLLSWGTPDELRPPKCGQ
jgi:predicted transcriptional regulator